MVSYVNNNSGGFQPRRVGQLTTMRYTGGNNTYIQNNFYGGSVFAANGPVRPGIAPGTPLPPHFYLWRR